MSKNIEEDLMEALRRDLGLSGPRGVSELYVLVATIATKQSELKESILRWRDEEKQHLDTRLKALDARLDEHENKLSTLHDQSIKISLAWALAGVLGVALLELAVLWAAGILNIG